MNFNNKIKLLFFLLYILGSFSSFSQGAKTDSLHNAFFLGKVDSFKVKAARQLSRIFQRNKDSDSAFYYSNKALEISRQINWNEGKEASLIDLAIILSKSGNHVKALELLFDALKVAESRRSRFVPFIYVTIGSVYNRMGNYREAISSDSFALRLREKAKLKKDVGIYSNIGDAYLKDNRLDSALKYQNIAYELSIQTRDERWLTYSLCNLGNIHSKLKNFIISNGYYRSATEMPYLQRNEADDIPDLNFEIFLGLAKNYKALGKDDSSYSFARLAFMSASKTFSFQNTLKIELFLNEYFKKKKIVDSILKYQDLIISHKDSLYDYQKMKKAEELRISESYRQAEREAQQLKEKKYRLRNIQLGLIGVFIPLFAAFVYFLGRKKKGNNKVILLLGIGSLLMLFEFISLLIHPSVERLTNHNAILMYIILLVIAMILVPLHHRLERIIKRNL